MIHIETGMSAMYEQVIRLAQDAVAARCKGPGPDGRDARLEACAELLAELGVIHNTPNGKRDWIEGRE